eukprot:2247211-Rhodomonas_salina.2
MRKVMTTTRIPRPVQTASTKPKASERSLLIVSHTSRHLGEDGRTCSMSEAGRHCHASSSTSGTCTATDSTTCDAHP